MKDHSAAVRYARALEGAVDNDEELVRAADELSAVALVVGSDRQIEVALENPALDVARKLELIDTLARGARLSGKTVTLMKILADRGSLPLLPLVAAALSRIRDRRLGIVAAEVTTASPLTPDLAERTRQALEKKTGRKVRLAMKTDPSILGGLIARVGSTVYDGSVRTRLEALRSHLARN